MSEDTDLRRDRNRRFLNNFKLEAADKCPKCARTFDPKLDQLVECPRCRRWGSTYCCNLGGSMVICGDCELDETDDDQDYGVRDDC